MSKENTVILELHRYNELRDLERNLHKNKFVIHHKENYYSSDYYEYLSKEEFKDKIIEVHDRDIKNFNSMKVEFKNKIHELKSELKKEQGKRRSWWN